MPAEGKLTRAFLAMLLPEAMVREAAHLGERLRRESPPGAVRWVDPTNFHLTLRFFGDLDAAGLARAAEVIDALDGGFAPIRAQLGTVSAFPSPAHPQVIWVSIDSAGQAIERLARRVDELLISRGFGPPDKPWKSHLTLGRVNRGASIPAPVARKLLSSAGLTAETSEDTIGAIALIESELRPQGSRYTALRTATAALLG